MEFPAHFNNAFFEEVLKEGLNEQKICVKNFSLAKGADGGDNYSSDIFRVKVEYESSKGENEVQWLIIKYLAKIDQREMLKNLCIYENEAKMFKEIIPKLEETIKEIDEGITFSPKLFYATETPVKMLIFQDLKVLDFEIASRIKGLDLNECRLVVQKMAKFHAASVIVADRNPHIFDEFNHGIFSEKSIDTELIKSVFRENVLELSKVARNWNGFDSIAEKLDKIYVNFRQRCLDEMRPRDGQFSVLNHGDLWINNMMFKYDSKRDANDVIFLSYWTSPGIDVNAFLDVNLQPDVVKNHREELFDLYCNSFLECLTKLKHHSIPTYEKLKREIEAYSFYGVILCIGGLPLITLSKEQTKEYNFETLTNKEVMKSTNTIMFNSPRVQEVIKFVLKRGNSLGALD